MNFDITLYISEVCFVENAKIAFINYIVINHKRKDSNAVQGGKINKWQKLLIVNPTKL